MKFIYQKFLFPEILIMTKTRFERVSFSKEKFLVGQDARIEEIIQPDEEDSSDGQCRPQEILRTEF